MRSLRFRLALVTAFLGAFVLGCASGQPRMNAALDHLLAARRELVAASADKGGHRERAIELVDRATAEVQRGIEFARSH